MVGPGTRDGAGGGVSRSDPGESGDGGFVPALALASPRYIAIISVQQSVLDDEP